MKRVKLSDIKDNISKCKVIIDKYNRIADGVNQGRIVYEGDGVYYKIFHKLVTNDQHKIMYDRMRDSHERLVWFKKQEEEYKNDDIDPRKKDETDNG